MEHGRAGGPKYDVEDEHIVRRLGWALIQQWHKIPKETQDSLERRALAVHDSYQTVQLKEQIAAFIRKHTGAGSA